MKTIYAAFNKIRVIHGGMFKINRINGINMGGIGIHGKVIHQQMEQVLNLGMEDRDIMHMPGHINGKKGTTQGLLNIYTFVKN